MKEIKEPAYNDISLVKKCMSNPVDLLWDHEFINLRDFEVLHLCEDITRMWDYLEKVFKRTRIRFTSLNAAENKKQIEIREKTEEDVFYRCSLVWAALYHHHDNIVPDKYKHEI